MRKIYSFLGLIVAVGLLSFVAFKPKPVTVFLIGDSTVADYTLDSNYAEKRFPITGWGQVFQSYVSGANRKTLSRIIKADSAKVDDRAKGGRSTRTFFEEGRWAAVFKLLKAGDLVLIQFGHNDAAKDKPERYVGLEGYKEFLRLYINQSREKGALPVLITPVTRNYPWKDGVLGSAHGDYPAAMKQVAQELNVPLIDLTVSSATFFTQKGQDYVSAHYFMNLPAGQYTAYPNGQKDNTHFQPEGAKEVARLVFEGLQTIKLK